MRDDKRLESTRRFRKTKRGLVTNLYHKMRARRGVEFSLEWLHDFSKCKKFDRIFDEWVSSGYKAKSKPTIDRINNKKGYEKNNIQWLSWSENRFKQSMERRVRKGAVIQYKGNKKVAEYMSQRQAVRETGLNQSGISMCLTGKRNTCGGFGFVYKSEIHQHPELLEAE